MSIMNKIQYEKPIKEAKQLYDVYKGLINDKNAKWIFRGQKRADNKDRKFFQTTLEKGIDSFGHKEKHAPDIEKGLLRKFKRNCSLYLNNVPAYNNYLEWFALMQHYGAPTRLLDWSYSFYFAVYMALNDMEANAEVWAIDTNYIIRSSIPIIKEKDCFKNYDDKTIKEIIKNDSCSFIPDNFKKIFIEKQTSFVLPMNPYYLNERLTIQQGLFLCPGDVSKSFDDNIRAHFNNDKGGKLSKKHIKRFKITEKKKIKKEILQDLHRMNMNNSVFFPGLSGFAESLNTLLAFPYENKRPGIFTSDSEYVMEHSFNMNKSELAYKADKNEEKK